MKKHLLILLVTVAVSASGFSNPVHEVRKQILQSFKHDLPEAAIISWEAGNGISKATFILHDQVMCAYYNDERSELIAITRNLKTSQLSIGLQADLKKELKSHWMTELFEISSNDQTTYYATIENQHEIRNLKSEGFDGWTTVSVTRKN
jgi:hypothetical protein